MHVHAEPYKCSWTINGQAMLWNMSPGELKVVEKLERSALGGIPGNRGHHAGTDRQQSRETPWRSGLLLPQEGQLVGWEGLGFYNLLPGPEEMLACFVETFYPMAEGYAP